MTYNPGVGTATWTSLDGSGGTRSQTFPATGIAFDSVTGDLYVSNDWGVLRLANGSTIGFLLALVFPMSKSQGLRSCRVRGSSTLRRMGAAPGN